jgi:hypothetical protein
MIRQRQQRSWNGDEFASQPKTKRRGAASTEKVISMSHDEGV